MSFFPAIRTDLPLTPLWEEEVVIAFSYPFWPRFRCEIGVVTLANFSVLALLLPRHPPEF